MPNLNFTSSSFAQQDRYAQTTVSYESRNMQNIPFYPGVDHKAKLRGIMALTLVITIVVGAILGTLYGFRDYIIDWAKSTPIYSAVVGDDENTPPPVDEEMNVSLAALDTSNWISHVYVKDTEVTYNGQQQEILHGVDTTGANVTYTFSWAKEGDSVGTFKDSAQDGWPVEAGKYIVRLKTLTINGEPCEINDNNRKIATLTINKASIPFPGIVVPESPVYNENTEYEIKLENTLPADYTGGYTIYYQDGDTKYSSTSAPLAIKNAGVYLINLTINGDNNYESSDSYTQPFPATRVEIKKATIPASYFSSAFENKLSFTYGKVDTSKLALDFDALPSYFPTDLKEALKQEGAVKYSTAIDNDTNVGYYPVIISFTSPNYKVDGKVSIDVAIEPANLEELFSYSNVSHSYSPIGIPKHLIEINKLAGFPNVNDEHISIEYTYYKGNTIDENNIINSKDIVNVGTYTVVVRLSTAPTSNYYVSPSHNVSFTVTINPIALNLDGITVKPVISKPFTGSNIKLNVTDYIDSSDLNKLPSNITYSVVASTRRNVGNYDVVIRFEDSTGNYSAAELTSKLTVTKKIHTDYYAIAANEKQSVSKDGTLHVPSWSWIDNSYSDTAWIEYHVGGKKVDGIDHLGTFDVDIVVTDENNIYTVLPVKFSVNFNFMTILMGVVIGIVSALIIAPSVWGSFRLVEKRSFKKFARLRARILHERGGARGAIVCEGHTAIFNWNSEQEIRDFPWVIEPRFGRLYLTHATLEYYDGDYKKNYRNLLVQLKDVTGVEIRGTFLRNKLIVFAKGGRHVFYVAPNTAYLWRRDIIHFRNLQHLYPMENNVVDNDYPFNYTVITDGD